MIQRETVGKVGSALLIVSAGIMLFLAQSAYWVNHTIFNQEKFTQVVTSNVLSQSSRDALAQSVVNKSLEDRPLVKRVVGDRAESLISGMLGSDLSRQAVHALSDTTYAYVTSGDREDVAIDLTSLKPVVLALVGLSQSQRAGQGLDFSEANIPDEIVLVESDAFPDLSGSVKAMLWLGPLFWLLSIVLFGLYIYLGRSDYAKRVYLAGVSIVTVAIIGVLTYPFLPPPIAASLHNIDLRPVLEGIVADFLSPFRAQMLIMMGCTIVALGIFNQRLTILRGIREVELRLSEKSVFKPKK